MNCQGNHAANDSRCPKVKQYRAALTKFLLSPAIPVNAVAVNFDPMSAEFPPLNAALRLT